MVPVKAAGLTDQTGVDQAMLDQLQNLIEQYQTRKTQYQTELQQAADRFI